MVTVAELKRLKTIKATRIDNDFTSDIEKKKIAEDSFKQYGYTIVSEKKNENLNCIEYELLNPNKEASFNMYLGQCKDMAEAEANAKKYMEEDNRKVISYTIEEEKRTFDTIYTLHAKVQGDVLYFNLTLNKTIQEKETAGELVMRSKDYYFQFTDSKGEVHKLYGDMFKADMIQDKVIKLTTCNVEYVLNI